MNTGDPRDRALDAMLGRRGPSGPVTAQCLDAETLAAYAEGGLTEPARADAEAHLGNCARCQSVMAAIVTSAGEVEQAPAGAPGRSWWPFDLRWLMPLAGAAAALVLWMVVPASGPEPARARLEDRTRPDTIEPAPQGPPRSVEASPFVAPPDNAAPVATVPASPRAAEKETTSEAGSGLAARPQDRRENTTAEAGQPINEERRRQEADQLAKVEDRATPAAGLTSAAPAAPPGIAWR